VTQKLRCVVARAIAHGERVYTLVLKPERRAPRFRPGQFLHLALDPYEPSAFWPESRVFSIASSPAEREEIRITYAVHGAFTERMEREAVEGREIWIKLPYGEFVIDSPGDIVLFAGGTGVTAFTSYLTDAPRIEGRSIALAYGARTADLLIYRDVVERCAKQTPALSVTYFVEDARGALGCLRGRISVDAIWKTLSRPLSTAFYISGPPAMLKAISADLRARDVAPENIHIDAWE